MNYIQQFKAYHYSEEPLFLGNAWDPMSAWALEKAGFKAIGTTSWGIARTLGFGDGENIKFDVHLAIIKSIVNRVKVPVSADIEAGYGEDSATIIENVIRTADLGVAGINIEDSFKRQKGLKDIYQHSDLLEKMRIVLDKNGYTDFYINARIDTYLRTEDPLAETIERGKAYMKSGASGVFVPFLRKEEEIKEIAAEIPGPLNILSLPGLTNLNLLKVLGVKRFSIGNSFSDISAAFLEKCALQLFESQDSAFLYESL